MKLCRRLLPALICLLSGLFEPVHLRAQPKIPEDLYVFDENMKPAPVENARYFLSIRKLGDSVWQWDTYRFKGAIVRMETFSDHDGKVRNGPAYYYKESGVLDSIAEFKRGLKDGTFYHLEASGDRSGDSLVWKIKYVYADDRLISTEPVVNNGVDPDTLGTKESVYPGGLKKWSAYLSKTLEYPDRAAKEQITGMVWALFTIDKKGKVGDLYLGRSVEYSLDREVQRVIRKSGDWIPGTKNGIPVKTWKIQPVNMSLR